MKVFVFHHPVAFPESEYGGLWVVRAEGPYQAGHAAWQHFGMDDFPVEVFQDAAREGKILELAEDGPPEVLDCFLT